MLISTAPQDFGPTEGTYRNSGSGSSRLSGSALPQKPSSPAVSPGHRADRISPWSGQSFASDAFSPTDERGANDFQLDMNLDDMEGIVDPNLANTPAQPPGQYRGPAASEQTSGTASTMGSMLLRDTMNGSSSFATTVSSGSGASSGRVAETPSRSVVSEAHRQLDTPFIRNPFGNGSSAGSIDNKPRTPPLPHTLSPKHSLPPSTQPRRPSQLRNMKGGSADSESSSEMSYSYGGPLQPVAPAWAATTGSGQTVFNDPFGSSIPARILAVETQPIPLGSADATSKGPSSDAKPSVDAAAEAAAAAWAAPESWGVEGDEDEDEDSNEDDEEWRAEDFESPPIKESIGSNAFGSRTFSTAGKPPPFGYKSAQSGMPASRGSGMPGSRTGSVRPLTSTRTGTARPGTSGSVQLSSVPVSLELLSGLILVSYPNLPRQRDLASHEIPSYDDDGGDHERVVWCGRRPWREENHDQHEAVSTRAGTR